MTAKDISLFGQDQVHLDPKRLPKKKHSTPASDRRRPNIQVKALTSSEVSEKYNRLLDMRIDIADFTKKGNSRTGSS